MENGLVRSQKDRFDIELRFRAVIYQIELSR